jgi:effector-binding domain-containing protein
MGQEDMEEMMGNDFQQGVDQLKIIAEQKASELPGMEVSLTEVEALPIYYIEGESKISEMSSDFFGMRYGKLAGYLGADAQNMLEMPLAIAEVWDEENDRAVIKVAMACESEKAGNEEIKKGMTHGGKAVKCIYMGPYDQTEKAHEAIGKYIEEKNLAMAGAPWEVYVTDPGTEPDSTKWVTHVYYPVL